MAEESKLKATPLAGGTKKAGLFNRFDNPWLNWKFLGGSGILAIIGILILIGYVFWDTSLALSASSPLNLPPVGFTNWRGQEGVSEHPLGTENSGRDMLALIIVGTPRTIGVGVIAASLSGCQLYRQYDQRHHRGCRAGSAGLWSAAHSIAGGRYLLLD